MTVPAATDGDHSSRDGSLAVLVPDRRAVRSARTV